MRNLLVLVAVSLASTSAFACSLAGAELFVPTLKSWERHPGPKQSDETAEGDYWERIPVPVVRVIKVSRGSAKPGASCDDAGTIDLEISLPASSTYSVSEFAVYFRVVSGKLPDAIFPDVPLVGEVKDGRMRIFLAWLDGHPKQQIPLDLHVEAFMVANDLSIGMSTEFNVKADIGG
ncbi:MAG: hypothetical protein R3F12_07900 [Lysobacteraceae bacterium]|nr:hypothetical protein [Xanthomonadaceae bacterium]